ncbi:hypothetical protein [Streptococcus oralis]|uniref:hypothetical protein n=1 Tax=Streptococcus oralis TaxID=1303 RepID=UPI0020008776|nr:hypothetical protein [Streptococcus oralis]
MSEVTLSENLSRIDIEVKRFLTVPLRLKILRECLLYLFFKMANDAADITVEKSNVHSSNGMSKTVYTVTVCN